MFLGDASRDSKKISLGGKGKSVKEDKNTFIQRTRVEREERKQDKERRKACARIVRFLRYARLVRESQRREREFFDQDTTLQSSSALPRPVLVSLLRSFLYFHQEPVDNDRFIKLCNVLLANIGTEITAERNYCGLALENPPSTFFCQMKKLLLLCLKKLSKPQTSPNVALTAAKTLVTCSHFTQWIFAKEHPALASSLGIICSKILTNLVDEGRLYQHLRTHLIDFVESTKKGGSSNYKIPPDQANVHLIYLVTLAIRPILVTNDKERFTKLFTAHILTIPQLISKIPPLAVQILISTKTTHLCLACLDQHLASQTLMDLLAISDKEIYRNAASLLGNILDLQRSAKVEYDVSLILALLRMSSAKKSAETSSSQLACLYSPDTVMSFFGKLSTAKQETPELDQLTLSPTKQPKYGFTSSIFSFFGRSTASDAGKYDMVPMDEMESKNEDESMINVDRLGDIAEIYLELMAQFEYARLSVLKTLTFSTPLTRSLWMWMYAYGIQKKPLTPKLTSILTLFCECYAYLLMVLDDSEFYAENSVLQPNSSDYNSNNNFALREVVGMLSYLKKLVVRLYLSEERTSPLRDAATRLVNQLYERDSRKPFCPPQFWIAKDIDFNAFFLPGLTEEDATKLRKILHAVPWSCSFELRVKIFSAWIANDRVNYPIPRHRPTAQIRRGHELEDGLAYFQKCAGNTIKSQAIRIVFVNNSGTLEEGIDQGGLFKEFVANVLTQGFNPNRSGLFMTTPDHTLYPNPKSRLVDSNHLVIFELLGKMLAKAMYDGVVVDLPLARFFLSKILGRNNYLAELSSMDTELYKNLLFIKHYNGNIEDLSLTFCVNEEDGMGNVIVKDLIANGKDQVVTNQDRALYIYLMADYYLNKSIEEQCRAFVSGFKEIIPYEWTHIFSPTELQQIISGDTSGAINVDDMEKNTTYYGYSSSSGVIRKFWKVVREMTPEEQKKLVKFITGYPRPPLMGFGALRPELQIRKIEDEGQGGGIMGFFKGEAERLPSASVCFNVLKLPNYSKQSTLREKLLYAINSSTGFELS